MNAENPQPEYDPNAGLCIVCGENWCVDTRCERCKRDMEYDRLERESNR